MSYSESGLDTIPLICNSLSSHLRMVPQSIFGRPFDSFCNLGLGQPEPPTEFIMHKMVLHL